MIITEFTADGFKNLKNISITPSDGVNVIHGENAQGKTNLIEAVWILSGARSFRGSKEKDMVAFDRDFARLGLKLRDSWREQVIEAVVSKNPRERKITLNGVRQRYLSGLFGTLKCVVFTPEDLELSKGSPENRRDFIDLCISQIKPAYSKTVAKYENVLLQRNALLKNISLGVCSQNDLDVWDEQMARLGAYISVLKYQYTKKLSIFAKRLYDEISQHREDFYLSYFSTVYSDLDRLEDWSGKMASEYLEMLRRNRSEDIRVGFTTAGVHRDDVSVVINGALAKDFGSQGQNRSAALAMKLGQAFILNEETSEMPVILLDDVLSELDKSRREFIISKLSGMQVFITCCEPAGRLKGRRFEMKNGEILNKRSRRVEKTGAKE